MIENFTRVVGLLRKHDLTVGTKNAYYLYSGTPFGFYQPRVMDIGLSTSGSSTTISTNGTLKLPTSLLAGAVIYVKTGLFNGLAPLVAGDATPTRWEERTVVSRPDDYSMVVNEAIDIAEETECFAYRVLLTGDASDEGWIGTGNVRERVFMCQVHSGGPVNVEIWQKTGEAEVMIDSFSVADGVTKVYGGVADFTRVVFGAPVAVNVSASLVNRRY